MIGMGVKLRLAVFATVALGLAAWFAKDLPLVHRALAVLPAGATEALGGPSLKTPEEAGLHKCRKGSQVVYSDQPCPSGAREDVIRGGSVNVVNMPKPAPTPASGEASGPGLVKGFDKESIERARDKAVEDAMKR